MGIAEPADAEPLLDHQPQHVQHGQGPFPVRRLAQIRRDRLARHHGTRPHRLHAHHGRAEELRFDAGTLRRRQGPLLQQHLHHLATLRRRAGQRPQDLRRRSVLAQRHPRRLDRGLQAPRDTARRRPDGRAQPLHAGQHDHQQESGEGDHQRPDAVAFRHTAAGL